MPTARLWLRDDQVEAVEDVTMATEDGLICACVLIVLLPVLAMAEVVVRRRLRWI